MGNTILELRADGKVQQKDFSEILLALDRESSHQIREIITDYDEISNVHLLQLINATHQTTLAFLKLSFTSMDNTFAQSLFEAVNLNSRIAKCWLLLGTNHLYYRDGVMANLNEVLQLSFPRRVTIDCESMTAGQVDELVHKVNQCEIIEELTVNIVKMDEAAALTLTEKLRANPKLQKWSLTLNNVSVKFDDTVEEEDLIEQFSGLMQAVKADISDASLIATGFASSLLNQGRTLMSAFTAPLTACVSSGPHMDEFFVEEATPKVKEKMALGKHH